MPNPTPGDLHVNYALTNVSVAYMQQANNYIASRVFPNVPVQQQGNLYWKYNKDDWRRVDMQKRAPGAPTVGSGWRLSTDTYFCNVWGLHIDVDDQTRANADTVFNLDRDATMFVTNQALMRRDLEWLSKYFTTSVWDTNLTGVAGTPTTNQFKQWDQAGSTPIEDVYLYRTKVLEQTGFLPNVLVVGAYVMNALRNHPEIIDRVKYTQTGFLEDDLIARALGIDRLVVAQASQNTAVEGATGSYSFMAGKHALLVYAAPNPSIMTPSGGYIFSWNGYLGAGAQGNRMKRFRIEERAADRVEIEMAFDMKVVATDMGTFFSGVVA